MRLRPATPEDAPALAALSGELGYPAEPETLRARLARLADDPAQLIIVAEDRRKVIGWLQAQHRVVLESGARAEITGLVVSAAARRRGVGRRLVTRAEQWAASLGLPELVVRSNTARTESHRFYPALGFALAKTQAVYRKTLG